MIDEWYIHTCQPREKFSRDKRGATERSELISEGGAGGPPPENFKNLHCKWGNLRYSWAIFVNIISLYCDKTCINCTTISWNVQPALLLLLLIPMNFHTLLCIHVYMLYSWNKLYYSGTSPYGHLTSKVTSPLRSPFFSPKLYSTVQINPLRYGHLSIKVTFAQSRGWPY